MADTAFRMLKIMAIVTICAVFMIAIHFLVALISTIVFGNVIIEFFALISMYLPFNALAVFGAIGTSIIAILSFLISKKIFDLTSWSISSI